MFGLDEKTLREIRGVLRKYSAVEEARIFGSRALGTERPNSDIDVALLGRLNAALVDRIKGDLEDIPVPFKFDVVGYSLLEHQKLKKHIDRFGKSFYQR